MAKQDVKSMLAEIEDEEGRLFAEFEQKLKEQRQKKLANLLKPLEAKREDLKEQIKTASDELDEIEKQIGTLTGTKVRKAKGGGGERAKRMTKEAKQEYKDRALKFVKAQKSAVSSGDVAREFGLKLTQIAPLLKELKKEKLLNTEGSGPATRYVG